MLLLTALIWGTTFVAQSVGAQHIGPFTFNAGRGFFAMLFLLAVAIIRPKDKSAGDAKSGHDPEKRKNLLKSGIICGVCMFAANVLQQAGLSYTTVGKSGFITALYVVMVPTAGIFLKKRISVKTWICVFLAAGGLYLLCINENSSINIGDVLTLLCAAAYTVYILIVDKYAGGTDVIWMAFTQFATLFSLSMICVFVFEPISITDLQDALLSIVYAGILSSGIAYTLQIAAQRNTDPTSASLIMSLESVFALLAGMVFLGQFMTGKEITGCIIMFAAIILSQLPEINRTK